MGHRRESFGGGDLDRICDALAALAARGDVQIVDVVYPNPNMRSVVLNRLGRVDGVTLIDPVY